MASCPAAPSDQDVEDAAQGPSLVGPGGSQCGLGGQPGLNELPLLIAQPSELHAPFPLSQERVYP